MPDETLKGVPYPLGSDAAATLDTIIQQLAEWVDTSPGTASVTTSERDALAGPNLWRGRVVYNSQLQRLQAYDGTGWTNDVVTVSQSSIADLAVSTAKLATGAVTLSKIAGSAYSAAAAAGKLVMRDSSGRAQVSLPNAYSDIANKGYVDSAGSVASAPNTIVKRDGNGRSRVNPPATTYDIATKGYVDDHMWGTSNIQNGAVTNVKLADALGGDLAWSGWDINYAKLADIGMCWGQASSFNDGPTLPPGFRPVEEPTRTPATNSVSGYGIVTIETDGTMSCTGGVYFTAIYKVS